MTPINTLIRLFRLIKDNLKPIGGLPVFTAEDLYNFCQFDKYFGKCKQSYITVISIVVILTLLKNCKARAW